MTTRTVPAHVWSKVEHLMDDRTAVETTFPVPVKGDRFVVSRDVLERLLMGAGYTRDTDTTPMRLEDRT